MAFWQINRMWLSLGRRWKLSINRALNKSIIFSFWANCVRWMDIWVQRKFECHLETWINWPSSLCYGACLFYIALPKPMSLKPMNFKKHIDERLNLQMKSKKNRDEKCFWDEMQMHVSSHEKKRPSSDDFCFLSMQNELRTYWSYQPLHILKRNVNKHT
jgi:hypothetical protein